jgi:hypothetical protein
VADTVRVDISEAAVAGLLSDWSGPVGIYIAELTSRAEAAAKAMAPVSAKGSRYAPPGYLKSRVRTAHQHAADGTLLGMVGVPLVAGSRYPLRFVDNPKGVTRNASKRGRYGTRSAANRFLVAALYAALAGA